MRPSDDLATPSTTAAAPSAAMWSAALAGLFGAAVACGEPPADCPPPDTSAPADTPAETPADTPEDTSPEILSSETNTTITYAEFLADCTERGGILQTHAACAGVNSCQGLSFNLGSKELTEHTCKAMNSCAGISCVVLQEDQARPPGAVYQALCSGCHGTPFKLLVPPGTDHDAALERLRGRSRENLLAILAFGLRGLNPGGTASSNMRDQHERASRAEFDAVIDYMLGMSIEVQDFQIVGETLDMNGLLPPP
jgi:cytochrome c5